MVYSSPSSRNKQQHAHSLHVLFLLSFPTRRPLLLISQAPHAQTWAPQMVVCLHLPNHPLLNHLLYSFHNRRLLLVVDPLRLQVEKLHLPQVVVVSVSQLRAKIRRLIVGR